MLAEGRKRAVDLVTVAFRSAKAASANATFADRL